MCSSCSKRGKGASHGVSRLGVPFLRSQVSGKRGTADPLQSGSCPGSCSELCQRAEPSGRKGLASSLGWKSLQLIKGSPLSTPVWSLAPWLHGAPAGSSGILGMECAGRAAAGHSGSSSPGRRENSECELSLSDGCWEDSDHNAVLRTQAQCLRTTLLESSSHRAEAGTMR